jgi:hypothetical protein
MKKNSFNVFGYEVNIEYGCIVKINNDVPKYVDDNVILSILHYLINEGFLKTNYLVVFSWDKELKFFNNKRIKA